MALRQSRCIALLLACAAGLSAGEAGPAEGGAPNPEYLAQKAELEGFLSKRQTDLYELAFETIAFDRIVVTDRLGKGHTVHYLAFRLRNRATESAEQLKLRAKGYNEVLKAITDQYQEAKVVQEGGVSLRIDKVDGKDGAILERQEARPVARTVNLTAIAYTENGTRLNLLDDPVGSGAQNSFHFADWGEPNRSGVLSRVQDAVEEKLDQRLLSLDEIRKLKLEPFDGVKRVEVADLNDPAYAMRGWFVGEAYGVILFDNLADRAHHLTVEVRGLSNKFRVKTPDTEKGKVENYLETRYLRRTYVLHIEHPGDEFYRDLDTFTIARAGWEWVPSFQRVHQKKTIAYARYFSQYITDDKGERNKTLEETEFWPYFSGVRELYKTLPDIQATLKSPEAAGSP